LLSSSQLDACAQSGGNQGSETPLGKDSPVLHVLYETVVPPWLLLHWVAFRTTGVVSNDPTELLSTFLDLLHGPDQDLFAWDDHDDYELCRIFAKNNNRLELYPQEWNGYMIEIPLPTWLKIGEMTKTKGPARPGSDDMAVSLVAVIVKYYSTPIAFRRILASLDIVLAAFDVSFDHFPFTTMVLVADKNYRERSTLANVESEEFWLTQNLQDWISAHAEVLCHAVWRNSTRSTLERILIMDRILSNPLCQVSLFAFNHRLNLRMNRTW
jgi:hypothetical protein